MNLRQFFIGRAIVFFIVIIVLAIVYVIAHPKEHRGTVYNPTAPSPSAIGTDSVAEPNFEGEADPSRMTLNMKTWNWVQTTNEKGEVAEPRKQNVFTLTFRTAQEFTVSTDCNSGAGQYSANGNAMNFSQIVSTEMACGDSQEVEFKTALEKTEKYYFTSRGQLVLELKGGGEIIFN